METFHQFIARYPRHIYQKGETILLRGDIPKSVFVIESGLVKTYGITSDGDERLIAIESRNEDFPIGYSLGLIEASQYFYQAFTRCSVRLIPREQFLGYLHSDIAILYERHARLVRLLMITLSRIEALEQPRARDKVLHTLMYMVGKFGVILRPHKTRFKLSVTQQEIANLLGITRETTSIELKKLEVMKLVSHTRKNYIIYIERLRKYLDDQK